MLPGFSGQQMQSKSNLSLASRSYTKIGKEPEKECSTGGWWRWPWPPCPAPPLFPLWVRPTSSPFWQSERGSAQPQGMPLMPSCQFMIQYKLQQLGSGKTVGLWNCWVENLPQSQNLFLVVSLKRNVASLFPRSPASVWISCLPSSGMSHIVCWDTTARASCCLQQLWITLKKLRGAADNISISLNQTNSLIVD